MNSGGPGKWLRLSWYGIGLLCACSGPAAEINPLLGSWLAGQTNIKTWSADVTQTRSLKTLTQPLIAHGRVWFAAPNRFRWEIGTPPQTIAVRQPEEMLVIYPRLKRAERYPLTGQQAGPWKDTLALLEAGFPRSQAELETRFRLVSQSIADTVCEVVLQPRSSAARRMMPEMKIAFRTNDLALQATELEFADGSRMRTEFGNTRLNPELEPDLFTPKLESDYKIIEPFKK
jgi:outer membrane lipoprotein-sorting protein